MKTEPTEKEKLIEGLEVEISNCQDDLDAASWAYEEGILISKREAVALLDLAKSSPKIKQLEWGCEGFHRTDGSLPDEICASTPFGAKYYIYHLWGTVFQLTHGYRTIAIYLDHGVEDVKAIAQADFERRVMECLDLKAQQKQALIDMMRGDEELGLYDDNPKNH